MDEHNSDSVGLGATSNKLDRWNLRVMRLCWLIAKLDIYSARELLPVALDPNGFVSLTVLSEYPCEIYEK